MTKQDHDRAVKELNKRKIFKEVPRQNGKHVKWLLFWGLGSILLVAGIVLIILTVADKIDGMANGGIFQVYAITISLAILGLIWLIRRSINR